MNDRLRRTCKAVSTSRLRPLLPYHQCVRHLYAATFEFPRITMRTSRLVLPPYPLSSSQRVFANSDSSETIRAAACVIQFEFVCRRSLRELWGPSRESHSCVTKDVREYPGIGSRCVLKRRGAATAVIEGQFHTQLNARRRRQRLRFDEGRFWVPVTSFHTSNNGQRIWQLSSGGVNPLAHSLSMKSRKEDTWFGTVCPFK